MSGPLLILLLTGMAALAAALLRRRSVVGSIVAAGAALVIAALVLFAPIEEPLTLLGIPFKLESRWTVLGRSFVLHPGNRASIGFLYLVGGLLFAGSWAAHPGRYFQSIGLMMQGMLAASLLIEPFLFAAIFLEFASMGGVMMLASSAPRATKGSTQLLILFTLAMMAILMTGWLLENVGVTSVTEELAGRVLMLLGLGFSILMFLPPFHFWLPSAVEYGSAYALAMVALLLQGSGLFFLLRFLDTYAWIRLSTGIFGWIRTAGAIMVISCALAASVQRSFRKAVAYVLLSSFGLVLVAIGLGTEVGYRIALQLSGAGALSMALASLGASMLTRGETEPSANGSPAGVGHRRPLAATASLVGLLGLAGFPLTPGFPARWALLVNADGPQFVIGVSVLLGTGLIWLTAARWGAGMFASGQEPQAGRLPRSQRALIGAGLGLSLVAALFPHVLAPWVDTAVRGLTSLMP